MSMMRVAFHRAGLGRFRRLLVATLVGAVALGLGGCSGDKDDAYVERPVDQLYNTGLDSLFRGEYAKAAKEFDEVERQHPYSVWATRAQLMAAYASYQDNKYDEAIIAAKRFIQLHPGHPDVAYAHYLVGISYYEQISDIGRDQKMTALALESLQDVVRRFPTSEYARDAQLKVDLTYDHLAGKEMEIGRYYHKQGNFTGAINRYRAVIERYQTTSHVPEALHRLVECYIALGVAPEAQTAAAVLGHNFPGSSWYQDSYALLAGRDLAPKRDEKSWISRALSAVF